jgi:hypothetical protein
VPPPVDTATPTPTTEIVFATPTATPTIPEIPVTAATPTQTPQPNVEPTRTSTSQPGGQPTPPATTVATLPPPVSPAAVSTPAIVPLTGIDLSELISGNEGQFLNIGFILVGLAFVLHGIYVKITKG